MERLLRNGDHVLLGHAPRDPFSGSPSGLPPVVSQVDFSDVFGGPPRPTSAHEARRGFRGSADACAPGGRGGGEEAAVPRRPWSYCLGERPVFGRGGSPESSSRRRQLMGDDFFSDIFMGNESACPTPTKMDRDMYSSTPSSRALSPARPLPPATDVLSRHPSLPAQFSFTTRLAKGADHLAFTSSIPDFVYKNEMSFPDVLSLPSIANEPTNARRSVQSKECPKYDAHPSFNGSTLHYQTPHNQYRLLESMKLACNETNDTERKLKNDPSGLEAYSGSGYFHFSMYKWATIGVTLVMPYNLKDRVKVGAKVSTVSTQILQAAYLPPDNQSILQGLETFQNLTDLEDKSRLNDLATAEDHDISLMDELKEVLPALSDAKSIQSDITDKSGDEEISRQIQNKASMASDYIMKDADDTAAYEQKQENAFSRYTEKAMQKIHDAPATMEDKKGSRAKGMVKEFVKIFKQGPVPRSGDTVENQAKRPRIRNDIKGGLEAQISARVANTEEYEEEVDNETLPTPVAANQNLGTGEKPASDGCFSMQKMDDLSSEVKSTSSLLSDSTLDILDAPFSNIEEAYIDNIDECMVEEVPQNQNEVTKADLHQEEIQMSDAKIREWSRGKEGNIRSLLSTLQYVLWPGSGWKPIPLVDIIEGTSVRRAYQKALLCLHPDKLQQKGTEMHQKYIAEKVFVILQAAWTEFDSLTSL